MEYRINRRTGDKISVIGLGSSSIGAAGEKDGIAALELAFERGVNYYDLAAGEAAAFPLYGKATVSLPCGPEQQNEGNRGIFLPLRQQI